MFVPLPEPGNANILAVIDMDLKDMFQGKRIRGKFFPMPLTDQQEFENQVEDFLQSGLVEECKTSETSHYFSETFLVEKKDRKTRRMVEHYKKLNEMTTPHPAFLPYLEQCVVGLARFKYKSKLDMRSGFWHVSLTPRAET